MEERRKERAKKLNIKLAIMLGILAGATLATSAILGPVAIAGFAVLGTPEGKNIERRTKNEKKYTSVCHTAGD